MVTLSIGQARVSTDEPDPTAHRHAPEPLGGSPFGLW
jgi:hypothetical protein